MPTDVAKSTLDKRARGQRNSADLFAILVLVPLIMCVSSIILSYESRAYEAAFVQFGEE